VKQEQSPVFPRVMTSALLVTSLLVLLLNDWYLKQAYGNWLTGKLSDFAGIMLLSLVLFALAPLRIRASALMVCMLFTFWKSEYSEPLIAAVQSAGVTQFGRVVDYTDLVALAMVPLSIWYFSVLRARLTSLTTFRRTLAVPALVVACLAMTASTTTFSSKLSLELEGARGPEQIEREAIVAAIRTVAEKYNMECWQCPEPEKEGTFFGYPNFIHYSFGRDKKVSIKVRTFDYKPLHREIVRALERELKPYSRRVDITEK